MPVLTEKMFTNDRVVHTNDRVLVLMDTTDRVVHTTNRENVKLNLSLEHQISRGDV